MSLKLDGTAVLFALLAHCIWVLFIFVKIDLVGVSAQSFVQAFNLTHTNFSLQLVSPNGKNIEFIGQDEQTKRWLTDFRTKSYSQPISLSSIDASRYSALLIPASNGASHDLLQDPSLASIVTHFVTERKPICAVGMGIAGLFGAKHADTKSWLLAGYSLTGPSVFELARGGDFATLPVIPEDFIKENDARYNCSDCDSVHVIVDRHVITGQNVQSTLTAVQNLILLCTQTMQEGSREEKINVI